MNDSKQDIMKVAVDLFAENGYYSTSMNMIARDADVSKGGLYWYFSSKKDLFSSIIEMPFKDYINYIKKVQKSDNPPQEKIKSIINYRINYIKKNQKVSQIIVNDFSNLKVLKEKIFKYKKQNEDILRKIFIEGVNKDQFKIKDPDISVLSFTSIINSIASNPDLLQKKSKKEIIEAITEQVFQGISK